MDVSVKSHSYLRRIVENLLEFQRSGDFCDVVVQLAGAELGAHSVVLAATSPPLRELLAVAVDQDQTRSVIRLDGYDLDVARLWLEFVYTGRCRLSSEKQLADVRELCMATRMPEPEPVCESAAPSSGLVGPDERGSDLVYTKSCSNSELNADLALIENFDSPEAEEDDHCQNSVELISSEEIPQEILHKESVNMSSASLEERPLVSESVTLDQQKTVIPDNEKLDDFYIIETRDSPERESSSDCDESQRSSSLSQTVSVSSPDESTSNSIRLLEPMCPNSGESIPVVTSTQGVLRDSSITATPLSSNECRGEKCNMCGYLRIVDACGGKAGETQTVPLRCKCLGRDERVVKLDGLDVKTRREKAATQRKSRGRFHACRLCGRSFGTHSGLYGHLSKQHPATTMDETHCGICRSSFASAGDFLDHVIVFGGSNQNLRSSGRVGLKVFDGNIKLSGIDELSTGKCDRPQRNVPILPESGPSMGSHKCPICLEVFWTHASLYRHTAQHEFLHITRGCRPTCGICQTSFEDVFQLVEHVTSKAGHAALQRDDNVITSGARKESAGIATRQAFDCSYCDRLFESRCGLQSHVNNMHLNGRPHKCPSCGNDFRFAKQLASHARLFHKIFICGKCGVDCSCSQEELKAARADSGNPKPKAIACPDCCKVFQSRKGYLNHRLIHDDDGAKSFVCEFCGRAFTRKDRLASHRTAHTSKAFPCTFCEKHFLSPARLREHTRTHSGESPLICSHCGLRFRTAGALRVHFVRKHSPLHGLKVVNYKCNLCARQFSSRTYLTMHLKGHSERLRTVKCDVCGRGFYDAYGLRRHMAVHAEVRHRPFLCYTCNKGFASRGNLQTHVLSHKKDRSFVCERCNKGFKFKGRLNKHRKVECRTGLCDMNAITRTDGDIEFACEEVVVDV